MRRHEGLYTHPDGLATGHYVIITAPENTALRDQVDEHPPRRRCATVRWKQSSESGKSGTTTSRACSRRSCAPAPHLARAPSAPTPAPQAPPGTSGTLSACRYLPSLFRAALITLVLSCVAMMLAVTLGHGHRDRPRVRRPAGADALTAYVEVMRGTPVLLQLFVIYYGVASVDPLAGISRRPARPWPQLRRLREPRSTAARSRRCRAASSMRRARSASATGQTLRLSARRRRSASPSRR